MYHILDTKGPTAHSIFVQCLGEEHSHPFHEKLFRELTAGLDKSSPHAKKRTRGDTKCVTPPEKRYPSQFELHGVLATQKYAKIVRSWRSWVSNGKWNETEKAEMEYLQDLPRKSLPLKVAVLLQSAIARIFRKEYLKAEKLLKTCDDLYKHVKGDNQTFLHGRCEYTWSWLYRYWKQPEKAKKHAMKAMAILFNVGPGEDRALANYGYGSILVDCHANESSPDIDTEKIESSLRFAIGCSPEDRGLDHIAPHSHLRLAQMHLGSTHYEPGKNYDPESIRKASESLKAVDPRSLPSRSSCMFYLTESDLYRCKGDITNARESATQALELAKKNNFETEITSADVKLKSLDHEKTHRCVLS